MKEFVLHDLNFLGQHSVNELKDVTLTNLIDVTILGENSKSILSHVTLISNKINVLNNSNQINELLNRFKTGYGRYQEFVTIGADITQINTWSAADKILKLFTENITYVSGNPTQIVVTDEITGAVLTTVFTYAAGEIINITDTLS